MSLECDNQLQRLIDVYIITDIV